MSNKKILIVEDDENIRELLRLYLEREGYDISEAENGAIGLSKWKAENPDMMLLDVMGSCWIWALRSTASRPPPLR